MADAFATYTPGLDDPFTHLALVDYSGGDVTLSFTSRAVYVGTAGVLKVDTAGGETITTPSLAAGWHRLRITKVYQTGSAATGLMVAW